MFTLQAGSNGSIQSNHNVCRFFVLAEALEMPNGGFNIEYQIQIKSAPVYNILFKVLWKELGSNY